MIEGEICLVPFPTAEAKAGKHRLRELFAIE